MRRKRRRASPRRSRPPAAAGHFDELRGGVASANEELSPAWERFFDNLGPEGFSDLNRRVVNLERQVRDNGITYNVYADAHGPQRPWSLDLFPLRPARKLEAPSKPACSSA